MQRELKLNNYIPPVTRITFLEKSKMPLDILKLLPLNIAKYKERKYKIRVLSIKRSRIAYKKIPNY